MAIDAIGGSIGAGVADLRRAAVSQEDFMRIFLTQLSFQDPLQPVDNREFLAQLAQFTAVEQTRQLNENLEGLVGVQASLQSLGLLGRTVEVSAIGEAAVGQVTAVSFRTGVPLLTVRKDDGSFVQDISPVMVQLVR